MLSNFSTIFQLLFCKTKLLALTFLVSNPTEQSRDFYYPNMNFLIEFKMYIAILYTLHVNAEPACFLDSKSFFLTSALHSR